MLLLLEGRRRGVRGGFDGGFSVHNCMYDGKVNGLYLCLS